MRSKSSTVAAILANPHHRAQAAVRIYNPAGSSYYDLGARVVGVEVSEDLDGPRTATVRLFRQEGDLTIVPLIIAAGLAPFGSDPVVDTGRRVLITASVHPDAFDVSGSEFTLFDGYVDEVSWPDDVMQLTCTDKSAKLRDTWIERERAYGLCQGAYATKGAFVWRGDLPALAVGDLVVPSDANRNGHYYRVTAASSAQGTTEPTWPTGGASTVVSGGVTLTESGSTSSTTGVAVETLMQQIIDDNGLSSVATLQCPVSPSWNILPYLQDRTSVLDALKTLSDQLGWTLRFVWNSGLGRFELTLAEPDRTKTTADRTLTEADVGTITETRVDVYDIRNAVRVTYSTSGTLDPDGNPLRTYVEATDSTSIARYGRRFMEVQEGDTSNIDTSTEANRMAAAILADLKDPTATVDVSIPADPWLELGDLISLPADDLHWSAATKLAVASYTHSFDEQGATTKLGLRGKPAARLRGWHQMDGRANGDDLHRVNILQQGGALTFNAYDTVGGTRIKVENSAAGSTKDSLQRWYEFHVSETNGFTPSSSTLASAGQQNETTLSDLVPGKTYYARITPVTYNAQRLVRGEPSAQFSFVAGKAKAGHLHTVVEWGRMPLNGGFETQTDDTAPPDNWTCISGTWDTDLELLSGSGGVSGDNYLHIISGTTQRSVETDFITVNSSHVYDLAALARGVSGSGNLWIVVDWYLSDFSWDSYTGLSFAATTTSWAEQRINMTPPSGVRFAKVRIFKETPSTAGEWYADSVRFEDRGEAWTAPSYSGNWQDVGSGWSTGGYRRDERGTVHIKGLVKCPSSFTSTVFTLPSGYRPTATLQIPVRGGDGTFSYVSINSSGVVTFGGTSTAAALSVTLDNIHFETF